MTAPRPHSTAKSLTGQEAFAVAVLLLALTGLYFGRQLFGHRALYWGDIGLYFTPMAAFLHDNLRAGRIPLWNPLLLCGTPYVGNPQTWPLYPFSALLRWVSAPYFLSLTVAFHVWLAGVGMFLFARRTLSVGTASALLAAGTFMFGGQLISKEQFPNMVQAAAYLPLVLLLLDNLIARPRLAPALELGAALGLQLLAAHAQMTLLTLYLAVAYGLFLLFREGRRPSPRLWGLLALAGVVAIGLDAGQFLPTVELFHAAWRQKLAFSTVNRFYLPLNQIGNFLFPYAHGDPFHSVYAPYKHSNYWETCCYVGVVPFAAALWGAWHGNDRVPTRFWSGAFVVGVWMALGGAGGHGPYSLYGLAYFVLPGFRNFHDPARCLLWATFALSLLAASGLQDLRERYTGKSLARSMAWLIVGFAFLDLINFGQTIYPLADEASLFPHAPLVTTLQADPEIQKGQARDFVPDPSWAWQRFTTYAAYRQDEPNYQTLWADTMTPNLLMPYDIPNAYGYEPVMRRDTARFVGNFAEGLLPESSLEDKRNAADWAGVMSVRYVILYHVRPLELAGTGLIPVQSDDTLSPLGFVPGDSHITLCRNTRWLPRARLIGNAPQVTEAALRDAGPDCVVVTAVTQRPATLVLADTAHPGWRATLDGQPTPILPADGIFRGISLPTSGAHRVVFSYRPTSVLLGLYISLLTVGALAGAACQIFLRRPRRQESLTPRANKQQ